MISRLKTRSCLVYLARALDALTHNKKDNRPGDYQADDNPPLETVWVFDTT